jgi:hypothetical protein
MYIGDFVRNQGHKLPLDLYYGETILVHLKLSLNPKRHLSTQIHERLAQLSKGVNQNSLNPDKWLCGMVNEGGNQNSLTLQGLNGGFLSQYIPLEG